MNDVSNAFKNVPKEKIRLLEARLTAPSPNSRTGNDTRSSDLPDTSIIDQQSTDDDASKKTKMTPQRSSQQHMFSLNGSNHHHVSPMRTSNSSRNSRGGGKSAAVKQNSNGADVMSPNRGKGTMHAFFAPKDSTSQPSDTISPKVTPSSTATPRRRVVAPGSGNRKKRKAEGEAQENRDGNQKVKSRKKIQVQDSSSSSRIEEKKQEKRQENIVLPPTLNTASFDNIEKIKNELEIVKNSEAMLREEVKRLVSRNEESLKQYESKLKEKESAAAKIFEKVMREKASRDALDARKKLASESVRLGEIVVVHSRSIRSSVTEIWKDGHAFKSLHEEMGQLIKRKENLEKQKKALERERRLMMKQFKKLSELEQAEWIEPLGFVERQESVKEALGQLKDKEIGISVERKNLESEKKLHVREIKRIQNEDQSRFNKHPVLHNRYLLMRLLGKGGFSEVWEAFDLLQYRMVACKIHQLNPHWSQEKKENYTKHATREYAIHKSVRHHRVVRLFDVFEIDLNSFATVLERCEGPDLDYYLKEKKNLPEREARALLIQIVSALAYLNGLKNPIIHYDLKPGNILFDGDAQVKITDFGLSKIIENDGGSGGAGSVELTSQGAGTYWYLPPECFRTGDKGQPPKISSKVDVWSVGVIFYQTLYGKKPFGDGMSQDKLRRENIILNARSVKFPQNRKGDLNVSDEAKAFMSECLEYDVRRRPDVATLARHSYLRSRRKGAKK